jgi:hypothetical protein
MPKATPSLHNQTAKAWHASTHHPLQSRSPCPHPEIPTPTHPQFPLSDYEAELQELLALDDRTAAIELLKQ